ncbi:MAG: 2-oxoisovalerate dehydrogenase E1 component [Chloroflexi bacterium]|nr:MAG: 2-oxoisovalerate dehydrogenase E1 component [Chloroflexota bacterium]
MKNKNINLNSIELINNLYKSIYRIRTIEEKIALIYPTDQIKSPVHLSIGQEAVTVGACAALVETDIVFGTYRGHSLYLAKGGDLKGMMAELYGKSTGVAGGKGGSMHLIDTSRGVMGMSAVVATTIPQAAGYAYAFKLRKQKNIVVSFFGDGATEEGVFHETLNFAALKKLPMIFVCENNQYAVLSHQSERQSSSNITERASVYGMHSEKIDQNDAQAIYEKINWARNQIVEKGEGPIFFECMTERYREHVGPNERDDIKTRSAEINDPLEQLSKLVSYDFKEGVSKEVDLELNEAIDFADKSSFPSNDTLYQDVYA